MTCQFLKPCTKEAKEALEEKLIYVGDMVKVRNTSDMLRNSRDERFKDFEGRVLSIRWHPFGSYGEVKTKDGIRVFDTDIHKLSKLPCPICKPLKGVRK